jgi:hypothetical protein
VAVILQVTEFVNQYIVNTVNRGFHEIQVQKDMVLQPRENPGDPITPDKFRSNVAFINLLQGLMVEHGEWGWTR